MVKLYTSSTCGQCPTIKKYLKMRNVEYDEVPIELMGADELVKLTGRTTVPTLVTDKGIAIGASFASISKIL